MTVTPQKYSRQPSSLSYSHRSPRSGAAQMDEVDALRLKFPSEDSLSVASPAVEPIDLEDSHYSLLRNELEADAQNLEAGSWSGAADQNYMRALHKDAVKRQDVIYELIQTEMHHVRTLKILTHVYVHELRQSLLLEEAKLEWLFVGVEALLALHQHFLSCLKIRQSQSQEDGGPNSYQISQLGDILISQFSGTLGDRMMEYYSVFCSHHSEAINFYREQLQNNKKLQNLIRKIGQLPLVRRLGVPECFLLVTQRITKYPVLVERIIKNTEADTEEHKALLQGLALIKDTISQVNSHVDKSEKAARLREICQRLEPKSQGRMQDGRLLRREDLIQDNRTLQHEGTVTCKTSVRQKDILAVLLSDVLLLLQEKDQKLVFAALDNKPAVISLQNLIVREVAHNEKAMFLICARDMYEMYEIQMGSREERTTWMTLIWEAVECCAEDARQNGRTAQLQRIHDNLKANDDTIKRCLTEKLQAFAALYEDATGQEAPHRGLLLRGDATDLQQGETLLTGAISEVESLQSLLLSRVRDTQHPQDEDEALRGRLSGAETSGAADGNPAAKNGDAAERPGGSDGAPACSSHTTGDPQEPFYSESREESADDDTQTPNSSSTSGGYLEAQVCGRLMLIAQGLYSLQALITQQDSQIELQHAVQSQSKASRHYSSVLLEQEKQRNLEKQKEELANLHKVQAQHRDAKQRWEKERERQDSQIQALEADLRQRQEDCRKREEKLGEEKAELERKQKSYQEDLERLRDSTKSVEKREERLSQEEERLEKLKKHMSTVNPGLSNYDDPPQYSNLSSYQSFRGSIITGAGTYSPKLQIMSKVTPDPKEVPPKVPPRKESISPQPPKPELPIHLISTTNQVHKPAAVQQQIPTKLAAFSKGREKGFKKKPSHQRRHSAASLDVNQVVPIRVNGNEGGSLRANKDAGRPGIHQSDAFNPAGSAHSVKVSQSFSTHKRGSIEAPPPVPPPFPKEVLERSKEKVIFL